MINIERLRTMEIGEFKRVIKYPMDDVSSIDIDDHLDFAMAEWVIENVKN